MELRTYLEILWRRKWAIIVTTAVTLIVVGLGTFIITPVYTASATLRVPTAPDGSVDYGDYMYAERLMNTYAEIVVSRPVLEELAQRLDLDEPPPVEAEILVNTELVQILVEDPDPVLAALAANTLAEILVSRSTELYGGSGRTAQEILSEQLAQVEGELNQARREYERLAVESPEDTEGIAAASRSVALKEQTYAMLLEQYEQARTSEALRASALSVIEPAAIPEAPSKPRIALNVALGLVFGLVGGVGLAFLFENLDTTLYTAEQVEAVTAVSTLGRIPTAREERSRSGTPSSNGKSSHEEAYRRLRTNILALGRDFPLRTLLVTSATPGQGKSTVVAGLAVAMAQSGRRVIAVDANLRRPTIDGFFYVSNELGLSNILRGETVVTQRAAAENHRSEGILTRVYGRRVTLRHVIQDTDYPGLWVLPSGPVPDNPPELLGSPQMTALLDKLVEHFDMVVLDAPPLAPVTDAAVLAPRVDGVLLVVRRARARREDVQSACRQLANVKARLIGVVVNQAAQDGTHGR
jgi:Mrp family chromosome partitioning ATPase/uncharacterized protein involved in exopolysaccharide biosynthesis